MADNQLKVIHWIYVFFIFFSLHKRSKMRDVSAQRQPVAGCGRSEVDAERSSDQSKYQSVTGCSSVRVMGTCIHCIKWREADHSSLHHPQWLSIPRCDVRRCDRRMWWHQSHLQHPIPVCYYTTCWIMAYRISSWYSRSEWKNHCRCTGWVPFRIKITRSKRRSSIAEWRGRFGIKLFASSCFLRKKLLLAMIKERFFRPTCPSSNKSLAFACGATVHKRRRKRFSLSMVV